MKYIIRWDAGHGPNYAIIEEDSEEEADMAAYHEWRQEAENNADYEAMEWTQELEDDYL